MQAVLCNFFQHVPLYELMSAEGINVQKRLAHVHFRLKVDKIFDPSFFIN